MNHLLNHQKNYWKNFTNTADTDTLAADLNASWDNEKQEYTEYQEIHDVAKDAILSNTSAENVLDFGAGLGRNLKMLEGCFENVFSFDTQEMCARLNARKLSYKLIMHKWEDVKELAKNKQGLDMIFECTVFQHMPPQDFVHKLISSSYISRYLYSHTRSYNDFLRTGLAGGLNMLKLIESTNCWDIVDITMDKTKAGQLMDETHFSVLLKSNNFNKEAPI